MTTPSPKQLREFITTYFNDSELNQLCSDYFPEVYDDFTIGMLKPDKVLHLLGYCRRRELTANLLGSLEKERKGAYQKNFAASGKPTKQLPKQKPSSFIHQKTGMEFVRIPAGEFMYGDELEVRNLPEYWISKTAVTQAVYQRFIDANPRYAVPFVEADWAKSYNWNKRKRTFPADKFDHPMVLVSWHDAIAFCKWAGLQLPTEKEWEKAARGTDGRKYPWGNNEPTDKLCNFNMNVGQTTPVRHYSPQGDSPYDCIDMSGNVWEWCLNKYKTPTDTKIDDSGVRRVLRGGSWNHDQYLGRTTFRNHNYPYIRGNLVGCRVVCVITHLNEILASV